MNSYKNFLILDSATINELILTVSTPKITTHVSQKIQHLESELIPLIDNILKTSNISLQEIDAFIIGRGPGSFMGLRLGFTVLRTWAWLYNIPITMLSSLDILTYSYQSINSCKDNSLYIPCIDAKMKQVFCNITYNKQHLLEDSDISPDSLAQYISDLNNKYSPQNIYIFGSGADIVQNAIPDSPIIFYTQDFVPNSQWITRNFLENLSQNFSKYSKDQLELIVPNYIRLSAAEIALNDKKKDPF